MRMHVPRDSPLKPHLQQLAGDLDGTVALELKAVQVLVPAGGRQYGGLHAVHGQMAVHGGGEHGSEFKKSQRGAFCYFITGIDSFFLRGIHHMACGHLQ